MYIIDVTHIYGNDDDSGQKASEDRTRKVSEISSKPNVHEQCAESVTGLQLIIFNYLGGYRRLSCTHGQCGSCPDLSKISPACYGHPAQLWSIRLS